ncbi:MAG: hypothetical protein ACTSPQ_03680, partial [Candidatus Helarchaeota archaeon]
MTVKKIDAYVDYINAYSVDTSSNLTIRIYIYDKDHNNISVSGVNVTYSVSVLSGNFTDETVAGNPGYYNSTIFINLPPKDISYEMQLSFNKENYAFPNVIILITVRPITTNLYGLRTIYEVAFKETICLNVSYNFTDGSPILGAHLKYFEVTIGSGNLTELGNGIYYFNLNSSCLSIGTYYII